MSNPLSCLPACALNESPALRAPRFGTSKPGSLHVLQEWECATQCPAFTRASVSNAAFLIECGPPALFLVLTRSVVHIDVMAL